MKADNLAIDLDYDKVLSGPEYFYCEHYHCTMSWEACLNNQETAKKIANTPSRRLFRIGDEIIDRSMSCSDCEQGKQAKAELRKAKKIIKATAPKRKRGRKRINTGKCKSKGCDRPATTRGMCEKHYKRWWREEKEKKKCKRKK